MNQNNSWLLGAMAVNKNGRIQKLTETELNQKHSFPLSWINLNLAKPEAIEWIEKKSKLEPWVIEILTDTLESRPRALFHKNSLLLVLRGVKVHSQDPDDMVFLRMWITKNRLITVQNYPVIPMQEILKQFILTREKVTPTSLMGAIIDAVLLSINRSISKLEYKMDDLEEEIIEGLDDTKTAPELSELQRQLVGIRRFLAPSREAFDALTRYRTSWFTEETSHIDQEGLHRMQRILEDVDLLRERARINQEALQATSVKMNQRNMYLLSVVATIFLPLSFLTGLFGMNVGGIPFASHSYGLVFITLFIAFMGAILLLVFRKLKWI